MAPHCPNAGPFLPSPIPRGQILPQPFLTSGAGQLGLPSDPAQGGGSWGPFILTLNPPRPPLLSACVLCSPGAAAPLGAGDPGSQGQLSPGFLQPSCAPGVAGSLVSPWGVLLISSSRRSARAQEAPLAAQPCPPILWGTEPPPLDKARAAQGLPTPAGQPMTHYPRPVLEMHPQESSWAKEGTGWDQSTCGPCRPQAGRCGGDSFNESVLTQATHSKGKRPTPEPTAWGPVPSILAEGPSHFPVPPAAGRGCPGAPTG